MAPAQQHLQTDGFISVTSRKYRKFQELLHGRSVLERWLIVGIAVLSSVCFVLLVKRFRKGVASQTTCLSDECLISATTIMQSMNTAVDPCDNFFEFACGNWQNHYVSEPGQANSWFIERTRYISMGITKILGDLDRKNDLRSVKQARRLYRTCLNTDVLDEAGYEPVYKVLDRLGLPRTFPDFTTASYTNGSVFNVARTLALAQRYLSADILIQLSLEPDPVADRASLFLGPASGITSPLPESLGYHRRRPRASKAPDQTARVILLLKVRYMVSVIRELAADDTNNATALSKLALKILILESNLKRETDAEQPAKEFTFQSLKDFMSSNLSDISEDDMFDWQSFIDGLTEGTNITLTMNDVVFVRNPKYFIELQAQMINVPLEEFQQFIWWKVVEILIPHTTTTMARFKSSFFESIFPNLKKPSRKEVCMDVTKTFMNLPIAYEFYVRDDLSVTSVKVRKMLSQLQRAFKGMIEESKWTDRVTQQVTSKKVDAIKAEIGYPEIFETPEELEKLYEHIEIREDEYLQSMLDVKTFEVASVLQEWGKPIVTNHSLSILTDPLEVNAFYSRLHNSITIPAGILQMPFFYKGVDIVNYGAIGSILGHEMTHGFDIEGKNFDVNGKKTMWWSQGIIREYVKRAQCFIREYDQFMLNKNVYLNGTRTLAENMADNIGLRQSWLAYKIFQSENDVQLPGLKDYTSDKLFFLAYANVWCHKPDDGSSAVTEDDHSPNNVRVVGSLRNSREFADVWRCPVDSPMNPSKKCFVW
ncbi:neprilysin-like isoform X2 [Sipha flava]|nr:neprilysin-like isoform X2 [Sipha flava]